MKNIYRIFCFYLCLYSSIHLLCDTRFIFYTMWSLNTHTHATHISTDTYLQILTPLSLSYTHSISLFLLLHSHSCSTLDVIYCTHFHLLSPFLSIVAYINVSKSYLIRNKYFSLRVCIHRARANVLIKRNGNEAPAIWPLEENANAC